MQALLRAAIDDDNEAEVERILKYHLSVVRLDDANVSSILPFHNVCQRNRPRLVALFLRYADALILNLCDVWGGSPLNVAIGHGCLDTVRLLLVHPKVDVNQASRGGTTPFMQAAYMNRQDLLELIIGSGRLQHMSVEVFTARINIQDDRRYLPDLRALLAAYFQHPEDKVYNVQRKLKHPLATAAAHFATGVFLCDDFMRLPAHPPGCGADAIKRRTVRFFKIQTQLPMELQVLLSCRLNGLLNIIIPHQMTESAFRSLAWLCYYIDKFVILRSQDVELI